MAAKEREDSVFVGLDVGSSKSICVVAAPGREPGRYRLLGFGSRRSEGVRQGVVNDVEAAVGTIRDTIREAQFTSGIPISGVWAAIGGRVLQSRNCAGVAVLRGQEVTREDVFQAEANAREHALREAEGRTLIKLIPQGYRCGDVIAPRNPVGLTGQRLEALVHAIYGSTTNAQNMKRCVERAGPDLLNYEPHVWAAAQAVLTDAERVCGACVVDIGAETTSMSVFAEGVITFTDVRPWGADLFTRDLSVVLGIDLDAAEDLKTHRGAADLKDISADEVVQIESRTSATRFCSRDLLAKTLQSRAKELFGICRRVLAAAGILESVKIVVLTGGGSRLAGIDRVAAEVFGRRVRIGRPMLFEGDTPLLESTDATVAAGLVRCADEDALAGGEAKAAAAHMPGFVRRLRTVFLGDH